MPNFDPTKYGAKRLNSDVSTSTPSGVGSRTSITSIPPKPKGETYGATFPATGSETPFKASLKIAGNLPSSALNLAKGVGSAVLHPIETVKNLGGVAAGVAEKVIPGTQPQEKYADALGQFFKERYGNLENAQKTIINDPVGVATDIATVLGMGAGAVGKTAELEKIGSMIARPVTKAGEVARDLTGSALKETSTAVAGTASGVGKEALKQALKDNPGFKEGMRGKLNLTDILGEAKAGLGEVKRIRAEEYKTPMDNLKLLNPQDLDMTPVLNKARELVKTFGIKQSNLGKDFESLSAEQKKLALIATGDTSLDLSRSPLVNDQKKVEAIFKILDEWGTQEGDKTVAGMDLLKRQLRDFREPTNPTLNKFVDDLANSAKKVASTVEGYDEIQKTYGAYSDFIDELDRTLSLKDSATPDVAIGKLNSLLRDNAEYRRILADELKQTTGKDIMAPIAGKALNQVTPQGLSKYLALGAGYSFPHIIPYLAVTSPRIMGEFFRAAGITGRTVAPILQKINNLRLGAGLKGVKILDTLTPNKEASKAEASGMGDIVYQAPGDEKITIKDRGIKIDPSDIEAIKPVVFAELSNEGTPEEQKEEARQIINTILNRSKMSKENLFEIVHKPKQYQGSGNEQFNDLTTDGGETDYPTQKKLELIDEVLAELTTGDFKDNTKNSAYYSHDLKTKKLILDNKRRYP